MKVIVSEWIAKAEADFATAGRELSATTTMNYDAVCFHGQQAIEKLMKGLLIQLGIVPPRIHDLAHLDRLLSSVCSSWSWPDEELRFLSRAAVEFRYPGDSADHEVAQGAFEIASRLRLKLLAILRDTEE